MSRKLFAAALFALACVAVSYSDADAVDVAPPPREVKPDAKKGFGKFDKSRIDPEKLKALKEKFGNGGFDKSKIDPEKLKELKEKFGDKFGKGGFDKSKIDPEKLKQLKEKFKKDGGEE